MTLEQTEARVRDIAERGFADPASLSAEEVELLTAVANNGGRVAVDIVAEKVLNMRFYKSTCGSYVKLVVGSQEVRMALGDWSRMVATPIPFRIT